MKKLTPELVNELIRQYRDKALEEAQRPVNPYKNDPRSWDYEMRNVETDDDLYQFMHGLSSWEEWLKFKAITGDYAEVDEVAEKLCEDRKIAYKKDSTEFCELCRGMLNADSEATGITLDFLMRKNPGLLRKHGHPIGDQKPAVAVVVQPPADEGPFLSELMTRYVKYRDSLPKKWSPKKKRDYVSNWELFIEYLGDVPLRTIEQKHCAEFRDMLLKYPTNRKTIRAYKDVSISELMKMDIPKTLGADTINNRVGWLKAIFNQARIWYGHIGNDLTAGLYVENPKGSREKRAAYTNEELTWLFCSAEYLDATFEEPFQFWTPLIALFHGMRQKELAQLYLGDIKKAEDGTWVFVLTGDAADKSVKNDPSRRLVPVHPFLLKNLNFIGYCDTLRRKGEERLFPELPNLADGYGVRVGSWFKKYKASCGIVVKEGGAMKDFHSFRKTFATRAARLKTPKEMRLFVAGHSMGKDEQSSTYIEPFEPKQLLDDVISKIDFHKLVDMSHLKTSRFVIK